MASVSAMTDTDIKSQVETSVRDHWKAANFKDVHVNDIIPRFFHGKLFVVSIIDANNDEHENYVYVVGNHLRRYDSLRSLVDDIRNWWNLSDLFYRWFE